MQQRAATVLAGAAVLFLLPKIVTLVIIGGERVLIGSLLAVEEVLVQLLFKGGVLAGLVGAVGVAAYVVWSFAGKKASGGGGGDGGGDGGGSEW